MLGTTDIPMAQSDGPVVADGSEVAYTLESVNRLIPEANLTVGDVLWSYSGMRPLPYSEGVDDPSKITRDYRLETHSGPLSGLLTVVGGKWTTHRALAEDVAKKVRVRLGLPPAQSLTRTALLPGAPGQADRPVGVSAPWLTEQSRERIERVYGALGAELVAKATGTPALQEVVDEATGALAAEVWWAIHREGAKTLGDIVVRRMATFINARAGLDSAHAVSDLLVRWGDWSADRGEKELDDYAQWIRRYTPQELDRAW